MYVLYGGRFTRAIIVEMVFAEGNIPYELKPVDTINQEHLSPEFLAINPAGMVPAMITPEGETLYETPALSLHLAEQHGLTDLVPSGNEPERGLFLSGYFYLTGELEPILKRHFFPHRHVVRPEDTSTIKAMALDAAHDRLSVINGKLAQAGPYHLGERFSLVDVVLAHWVWILMHNGTLADLPAIENCVELVARRPKLKSKFAHLAQEARDYAELLARGEGVS